MQWDLQQIACRSFLRIEDWVAVIDIPGLRRHAVNTFKTNKTRAYIYPSIYSWPGSGCDCRRYTQTIAMASPGSKGYGLGDPTILDKIDRLFACGVGDHINLPQIVVVGDQSSGKSSILEGLIRMPLPRDSGLCTRFATQIIFKRSASETISVSILGSADSTAEHKAHLQSWTKRQVETLDSETFTDIMSEVFRVRCLR